MFTSIIIYHLSCFSAICYHVCFLRVKSLFITNIGIVLHPESDVEASCTLPLKQSICTILNSIYVHHCVHTHSLISLLCQGCVLYWKSTLLLILPKIWSDIKGWYHLLKVMFTNVQLLYLFSNYMDFTISRCRNNNGMGSIDWCSLCITCNVHKCLWFWNQEKIIIQHL